MKRKEKAKMGGGGHCAEKGEESGERERGTHEGKRGARPGIGWAAAANVQWMF